MENFAQITPAIALGPLDGRYRSETSALVNYLSEAALNRARLKVEAEWVIFLSTHHVIPGAPAMSDADCAYVRQIVTDLDSTGLRRLKDIENETKHDVKAVEYYLKEQLERGGRERPDSVLSTLAPMVHIFFTSEDVNNVAYALNVKSAMEDVWQPAAHSLIDQLTAMAHDQADTPMLAHTHGQPATPTTLGKELAVMAHRLDRQYRRIVQHDYLAKSNGATGTYGAHVVALPEADWIGLSRQFIEGLNLTWNPLTTQIESHDWMAELFSDIARFNRIAHNIATDMWTYISWGYFHQNLAAQGSTGSSTMPHKVNPIRFENAEANFEISCSLLDTLGTTLVTSRMQRDLTDSSTLRNIGPALGHSLLALTNLHRGLSGVDPNPQRLSEDLEANWEVLAEPIQQVMRVAALAGVPNMDNPYERLKELTRGHTVNAATVRDFIRGLGLPTKTEERLLALTPATYTGRASQLVDFAPTDA